MIGKFYMKHKGETALIIGNGRSLELSPVEALTKKYKSFAANKIYEFPRDIEFDYWSCVDQHMLHECIPWVLENWDDYSNCFVPKWVELPGANRMNVVVDTGFSRDPGKRVIIGGTVSYVNMQLAKFMGFDRLLLVGFDHDYPKSSQGVPGSTMIANGEDPDHFSTKSGKPYFSENRIYARPELDNVEAFTYKTAVLEFGYENIVNISQKTTLTVFKRDEAKNYL